MTPERFHEIRKSRELSQQQLADKLDVTRLTVYNWEKGKFRIPDEIEVQMVALSGAAKVEDPASLLLPKHHPECFVRVNGRLYYTLEHPRWYMSNDCPLRFHVPSALQNMQTTVADLAAHKPISMERVVELFLENWPTPAKLAVHPNDGWMHESNCKEFLMHRGRDDLLHLIPHDSTNDAKHRGEPIERTPEQIEDSKRLQADLDAAFNLTKNPGE